ncbi:MAG: hypothetical protein AAGB10_18940 [Pseudomonadota bacterium]
MRVVSVVFVAVLISLAVFWVADFNALSQWVLDQQRAFQNQMAASLRALRAGDVGAYFALFAATGAYGFVHALGPGHGKYLVGGVGLGTSVPGLRLIGIAVASSLLQSIWAITLVYGGFALLQTSAQKLMFLAEDVLAPASYLAISMVGLVLAARGIRALLKKTTQPAFLTAGHRETHGHHCGCGHSHGPTPEEVNKVGSVKEAIALIVSVAIRPCTGAIFLLVITWQMDVKWAGGAAAIIMGFGTAALTSLVAVSSIAARRIAWVSADVSGTLGFAFPAVQIASGALICWISLGLLTITL